MSGDETFVAFACLALAAFFWLPWCRDLFSIPQRPGGGGGRPWLVAAPPLSALLLFLVLKNLAASDVRDDPTYLSFYLLMGIAWMGAEARNASASSCVSW